MKYLSIVIGILCTLFLQGQNIEIAVHRGANRVAPENTMASSRLAATMGGDYLEIDVRQNREGIFFNFHDDTVDRTTNGSGDFYSKSYAEIKELDAGSWFRHEFAGERVPTVEEIVLELKGKIKFYFDFKSGDINAFIELIKKWGVADDCFFTLQPQDLQAVHSAGLAFKCNVSNVKELKKAYADWNLKWVEVRAHDLSEELVETAHKIGVQVMVYIPGDQYELYLHSLNYNIDRINLDNPSVFKYMEKTGEYPPANYLLHRGGIVNAEWTEYDPVGIQAAINQGFGGLEFDVRQSIDRQLVVHHDASLKKVFGVDTLVSELTLAELKAIPSLQGDYRILTLEEYLNMVPENVLLMPDLKAEDRNAVFYEKLETAIEKRHSMNQCVFMKDETRKYFWGKSRFKVLTPELYKLYADWQAGREVACHYFFFDDGNKMPVKSLRIAQKMSMDIIAPVNTFHYKDENMLMSGQRDIRNLRALGVQWFQVDAVFLDK